MNLLKRIDIFGNHITFSINKEEKFKTKIGGFFTLVMLLVCFMITFLLGKDFYYRTNPHIVKNMISPKKSPTYKLNNTNLVIPYRLEFGTGKTIPLTNLPVYLKMSYNQLKVADSDFEPIYSYRFKTKKCSEITKKNITLYDKINASSWYCLDFDELKDKYLGGNYNENEDMSEIKFDIDSCNWNPKDNTTNIYNETLKCSNHTQINKFFDLYSNRIYINILLPGVIVDVNNFEDPIILGSFSYFRLLDFILTSDDYIYLDYKEFRDDKGLIFESETRKELLTFEKSSYNSIFVDRTDYTNKRMTSLSRIHVTMNKIYPSVKRSFMKLQNLTAICGGFISFVRLLLMILYKSINDDQKKKNLINYFITNKNDDISESDKTMLNVKPNTIENRVIDDDKMNENFSKTLNQFIRKKRNIMEDKINEDNKSKMGYTDIKIIGNNSSIKLDNVRNMSKNNDLSLEKKDNAIELSSVFYPKMISSRKFINDFIINDNKKIENLSNSKIINESNFSSRGLKFQEKFASLKLKRNIISRKENNCSINKSQINDIQSKITIIKSKQNKSQVNKSLSRKFCFKRISSKDKKLIEIQQNLENKILQKIDIIYYLKTMKYIEFLKNLFLNKYQKFYLKNFYLSIFTPKVAANEPRSCESEMIDYLEKSKNNPSPHFNARERFRAKVDEFILLDLEKKMENENQ